MARELRLASAMRETQISVFLLLLLANLACAQARAADGEPVDAVARAGALHQAALVFLDVGDKDGARQALAQALFAARTIEDTERRVEMLARTSVTFDLAESRASARQALSEAVVAARGIPRWVARARTVALIASLLSHKS